MARRCVFCKAADISQEHVFAKWVRDSLPGGGPFTHKYRDGTTWQSSIPDLKANRTCRQCNNRWINRLDTAAKPLLAPAVRGQATTIGRGSPQAVVAAWCFKTVLLLELCAKGRAAFIKARDYRAFYDLRHPPEAAFVWLTAYSPEVQEEEEFQAGWVRPWEIRLKRSGADREGYSVTFNVGHFAAVVFGHDPPDDLNIGLGDELAEVGGLLQVWPPTDVAIHWPPTVSYSAAGLDALSQPTPSRR